MLLYFQECQDPCCNATACMLVEGAQCFSGACCTEQCRFVPLGTTCRAPAQECDIEEYCSGDASTCPQDLQKQDSTPCNGDEDYCFGGLCRTHDSQCQRYFGKYINNHEQLVPGAALVSVWDTLVCVCCGEQH